MKMEIPSGSILKHKPYDAKSGTLALLYAPRERGTPSAGALQALGDNFAQFLTTQGQGVYCIAVQNKFVNVVDSPKEAILKQAGEAHYEISMAPEKVHALVPVAGVKVSPMLPALSGVAPGTFNLQALAIKATRTGLEKLIERYWQSIKGSDEFPSLADVVAEDGIRLLE